MMDMIFQTLAAIPGALMVLGLLAFIYHRNSNHWRYLAGAYGRQWTQPATEKFGHLVLYGKHPVSKGYNGVTKVGIHRDCVSFRLVWTPDALFCDPLFIPYRDLKGWSQNWYLNADSVELQAAAAPDVKLVMPRDQYDWIRQHSRSSLGRRLAPSPNADRPVFWRWVMIITPLMMVPTTLIALLMGKG